MLVQRKLAPVGNSICLGLCHNQGKLIFGNPKVLLEPQGDDMLFGAVVQALGAEQANSWAHLPSLSAVSIDDWEITAPKFIAD
jgi:hypothetical protein